MRVVKEGHPVSAVSSSASDMPTPVHLMASECVVASLFTKDTNLEAPGPLGSYKTPVCTEQAGHQTNLTNLSKPSL